MENEQTVVADEKRRLQVYVDNDDVLARALGVVEADYECVRVNGTWLDKGLKEGDMVLVSPSPSPRAGDIVLLEEDGRERLGLMHEPGWLETMSGVRPLNATEQVRGVGVALVRALHRD
ncbi:MAG TPA: S24 family peptidase [Blastocatellia bacterium]|nr:S24 family peptidase [Blastocatellia bacterium]